MTTFETTSASDLISITGGNGDPPSQDVQPGQQSPARDASGVRGRARETTHRGCAERTCRIARRHVTPARGARLETHPKCLTRFRCAADEIDSEHGEAGPDEDERDQPVVGERLAEREHGEQELTGRREVLQEADGG